MTRDEIVEYIEEHIGEAGEDVVLFDGMEHAFLGVAERFEPILTTTGRDQGGEHRFFAVYSFNKMVEGLVADGSDYQDALDYLEFNTVGLYAGPNTPAIMRD
jgi:hypothetical protein